MVTLDITPVYKSVPIYEQIEKRNEVRDWLICHVGPTEKTNGRVDLNKGEGWQLRVELYGVTVVWFLDLDDEQDAVLFRLTYPAKVE